MSLALALTLVRIALSPLFLVLYLYYPSLHISLAMLPILLLGIMVIAEISDLLDGHLARKNNQVTELGKLLDPMADSIFRISVFLTFTQGLVQLPLLLVFVFFYRDSIISTLRTLCALRGVALAARTSGKIKAVIQAVSAFFILIALTFHAQGLISLEELKNISFYSALTAAIYTVYSGVEYITANYFYIKKALAKSQG